MQESVRIAYILQCHKNPKQVNRLISRLTCDSVDFFIHVDKKSGIQDMIDRKENVFFVPDCDRVDVTWGDYSQCEATLRLLACVLNSGKTYDYVWLISGQDYPIKSVREINDFLQNANGTAFINFFSEEACGFAKYRKRNEVKHFSCMMGPGLHAKISRRLWHYATGGREYTLKIFRRICPLGRDYFGSSWWCVPYSCVDEVCQVSRRKDVRDYFSKSLNPDESMFQTVYMHLRHSAEDVRDYLTYVDWSAGGNNPKILTKEDASILLSEGNPFLLARKFDENVDREIFDLIDVRRREVPL